MDTQTIVQKAREGFDEDFSKKNYMEKRTGDIEHLQKILTYLKIIPHSNILDLIQTYKIMNLNANGSMEEFLKL